MIKLKGKEKAKLRNFVLAFSYKLTKMIIILGIEGFRIL